jgi:hypothetical protein
MINYKSSIGQISMNQTDKSFLDRLPSRGRLINLRASSLFFAAAFTALSAQAQNPGATIESLASDLAALTARVAKLEGQIVAADLVGTYALHGFQVELSGGKSTQVSSYVYVGTAVLAADGTASLTATESGNTLLIGSSSSVSPFMGSGGGTFTSTWTYADGTLTFPGGLPTVSVAAGGRLLIGSGANPSDGTNVLLIFTRLK